MRDAGWRTTLVPWLEAQGKLAWPPGLEEAVSAIREGASLRVDDALPAEQGVAPTGAGWPEPAAIVAVALLFVVAAWLCSSLVRLPVADEYCIRAEALGLILAALESLRRWG